MIPRRVRVVHTSPSPFLPRSSFFSFRLIFCTYHAALGAGALAAQIDALNKAMAALAKSKATEQAGAASFADQAGDKLPMKLPRSQ